METPVGTIYSTTALKEFLEMNSISVDQFILTIYDIVGGTGGRISFEKLISSLISSDSGNLINIGSDKKLSTILPSISFDDLTDTDKVIFGESEYGGSVVTNLDTLNKNGFYTCYGTATGVPSSGYSWFITHQNSNVGTTSASQKAVAFSSEEPIVYERVKTSSVWGSWVLQGSGGGAGGGLTINPLGTITTDQTLVTMNATTAHVADTVAISLPTALTASIENVVVFDFTTTSPSQPTIVSSRDLTGTCAATNGDATVTGTGTLFLTELKVGSKVTIATVDYQVLSIDSDTSLELTANYAGATASGLTVGHKFIKWSSNNGGKAPSAYSILSGVHNVLVFKTHDNGITWEAEYSNYGGVETSFARPNLSANGTLGGTSFAISGDDSTNAYYAVDGNNATEWTIGGSSHYLITYNPDALKLITAAWKFGARGATGITVYGSNDNITYTLLNSFTGAYVAGTEYPLAINATEHYKYQMWVITGADGFVTCCELKFINATYIAT